MGSSAGEHGSWRTVAPPRIRSVAFARSSRGRVRPGLVRRAGPRTAIRAGHPRTALRSLRWPRTRWPARPFGVAGLFVRRPRWFRPDGPVGSPESGGLRRNRQDRPPRLNILGPAQPPGRPPPAASHPHPGGSRRNRQDRQGPGTVASRSASQPTAPSALPPPARRPHPGGLRRNRHDRPRQRPVPSALATQPAAPGRVSSPQQRWRDSVSLRPLPRAVPLPARFAPLARSITGQSVLPRFTSGAATRAALRTAGARAATTGATVHLPVPPDGSRRTRAVLAHELSHVRDAVSRKRFPGTAPRIPAAAAPLRTARPSAPAAHRRALGPEPHFLLDRVSGALESGERRARSVGSAVENATASGPNVTAEPGVRAGDVAALPVGGLGAVLARATDAARRAVADVATGQPARPTRGWDRRNGASGTPQPDVPAAVSTAAVSTAALSPVALSPADPFASARAVFGPGPASEPYAPVGQEAVSSATEAPSRSASTAAFALPIGETADSPTGPAGQADALLEIVEDRLIAELERRGGRFAGVF